MAGKSPLSPYLAGMLLLAPACKAGDGADFLILGNPSSFEILSRYEQPLTPVEKRDFVPFAPLRIVEEKTTLGDGITSAMEVDYGGHAYYLLRRGGFDETSGARRYRNGKIYDKPERTAGARLDCTRGLAPGGSARRIGAGEPLELVFTHGSHVYVKLPGIKPEYAWCPSRGPFEAGAVPAGKSATASAMASGGSDAGLDPALQGALKAKIDAANQAYSNYTRAFNRLTGDSRQPPRWTCSLDRDGMDCRLEGGMGPDALARSTAVLAEELRSTLLGRPFDVSLRGPGLRVASRSRKEAARP